MVYLTFEVPRILATMSSVQRDSPAGLVEPKRSELRIKEKKCCE